MEQFDLEYCDGPSYYFFPLSMAGSEICEELETLSPINESSVSKDKVKDLFLDLRKRGLKIRKVKPLTEAEIKAFESLLEAQKELQRNLGETQNEI